MAYPILERVIDIEPGLLRVRQQNQKIWRLLAVVPNLKPWIFFHCPGPIRQAAEWGFSPPSQGTSAHRRPPILPRCRTIDRKVKARGSALDQAGAVTPWRAAHDGPHPILSVPKAPSVQANGAPPRLSSYPYVMCTPASELTPLNSICVPSESVSTSLPLTSALL